MLDTNVIIATLVYTGIGAAIFAIAFFVMVWLMPFSVTKEIEEDQNTSLAIVMGSVILGLAMIISSTVGG